MVTSAICSFWPYSQSCLRWRWLKQLRILRCIKPNRSRFRIILKFRLRSNLASASKAQVTQARSAYYPTAYGSLTGVDAENDSRIAAGALNNPVIYDRYANGLTVSQLVTDFGRTHELVKSSNLHAQAQQENVVTTRADVLLQVDQSYFCGSKGASGARGGAGNSEGAPTRVRSSYGAGEK